MKIPFNENTLIKDIVNLFPKSSDLFKNYKLDFCCGGNRPLLEAAMDQKLDHTRIMLELTQLYQKYYGTQVNMDVWVNSSTEELIEHIQTKYHRELEEELFLLSPYVTKVAKVHGDRHPELIKVNELFIEFKKELTEHTKKEEEIVFPLLLELNHADERQRNDIYAKIADLEKEHDHAGTILKKLREITSDYFLPLDACGTYRLVFKRLETLEEATFMHVHLENNILFSRFSA